MRVLIVVLSIIAVLGGMGTIYAMFTDDVNEKLDQMIGVNVSELTPKELDPKFHTCSKQFDELIEVFDGILDTQREIESKNYSPSETMEVADKIKADMSLQMEKFIELGCVHDDGVGIESLYITSEQKEKIKELGDLLSLSK